jgi:predicted RNA-binding Zn-ribbon protein involved in translation (DUF1610 family)
MNDQNTFTMILLPSKPIDATIFKKDNFIQQKKMEPFVVGEGVLDYNCGGCGHTMLKSLRWGQITKAVYKCPKCGGYNRIELIVRKH